MCCFPGDYLGEAAPVQSEMKNNLTVDQDTVGNTLDSFRVKRHNNTTVFSINLPSGGLERRKTQYALTKQYWNNKLFPTTLFSGFRSFAQCQGYIFIRNNLFVWLGPLRCCEQRTKRKRETSAASAPLRAP